MNKTILVGKVLRVNSGGEGDKAWARVTLTNRVYNSQKKENETQYMDLVGFKKTAEGLKNAHEGSVISVEARPQGERPRLKKDHGLSEKEEAFVKDLITKGVITSQVGYVANYFSFEGGDKPAEAKPADEDKSKTVVDDSEVDPFKEDGEMDFYSE